MEKKRLGVASPLQGVVPDALGLVAHGEGVEQVPRDALRVVRVHQGRALTEPKRRKGEKKNDMSEER